jgi:hypothetical protein
VIRLIQQERWFGDPKYSVIRLIRSDGWFGDPKYSVSTSNGYVRWRVIEEPR